MTNIENETPVEDGTEAETPEADTTAAQPQDEAAKLAEQVALLQQDLLYARAETQNVTRRKDKEIADAHAYASTKFARDILSVADNLGRALAALSEEQRADDAIKPLITGLERSEEHTSELQSLMRTSYAVFCLKKKNTITKP